MIADSNAPAVGKGIGGPALWIDVTAFEVRPRRNRRNLDEATAQHEIGLDGCANRRIGFENLPVYFVHCIEVTHVSQVNVRRDHVLVAHASGLEYGSNI